MNVLIVGGSGFVGTALTRALRDRGHEVAVLSRSPDEADLSAEVETISGDVTEYDAIEGAFADRDVVVNLVALSPLFQPPPGTSHESVHLGGTENVVAAAEAHGVPRIVQMSALGADPDGATDYIRAKGEAEAVVRASSLDWTIVRPSVVFGDGGEFVSFTKKLTTPYVTGLPGGGKTRFQPIWVGDLAPMLADCVEGCTERPPGESDSEAEGESDSKAEGESTAEATSGGVQASSGDSRTTPGDEHVGETYELGGPEVLTLAEVAKRSYRAEGKSLVVLPVPMALARVGLTVLGAVPGFPMGADQYRSLEFDNTTADNDVVAFGRDPDELRTLADYLGANQA